jgi:hypothetical protein
VRLRFHAKHSLFNSKMYEILIILLLQATLVVSSVNPLNIAQCTAKMDGSLPSFIPKDFQHSGNVRRYYVSAEIVPWNYAPSGNLPNPDALALASIKY